MAIKINIKDYTGKVAEELPKAGKEALVDVVSDIKRVSSDSAPFKDGDLQKNRYRTQIGKNSMSGTVAFEAFNKGFDYARWTHNMTYNLGEGSRKKSGGTSKFGSGTIKVGTGYLKNTVETFEKGYKKHIEDAIKGTASKYS